MGLVRIWAVLKMLKYVASYAVSLKFVREKKKMQCMDVREKRSAMV